MSNFKKYGLSWETKTEDIFEHCNINIPYIIENKKNEINSDNKKNYNYLIQSDNYQALLSLGFVYRKKVDFIYIDPPYNTGATDWKYNNKFVDTEDSFRHSKWLNMMYIRLKIAKELITDEGLIVVAIDDHELFNLGLMLDQLFGEQNRIGIIPVRNNPAGRANSRYFATQHEYYLVYSKNKNATEINNLLNLEGDKQPRSFSSRGGMYIDKRPNNYFPIYINPKNGDISLEKTNDICIEIFPPKDKSGRQRVWDNPPHTTQDLINSKLLIFKEVNSEYKILRSYAQEAGQKPKSLWVDPKYDSSAYGATLLENILGKKIFDYPKSLHAVKDAIYACSNKNAIVLDFFAGSGTTGHAVLELNKEDGGNRQFILVTNNENNIAEEVTYPRLKNVINGYKNLKNEKIDGLGGNLKYYEIDFVPADNSDPSMYELAINLVDTLCLKENTFTEHHTSKDIKIFKNEEDHYCCIVFDEDKIDQALQKLNNTDGSYSFYIYSLGGETFDEELEDFISQHQNTISTPFPLTMKNIYKSLK